MTVTYMTRAALLAAADASTLVAESFYKDEDGNLYWAPTSSLIVDLMPVPGGQQVDAVVANVSASGILYTGQCSVIGVGVIASGSGVIELYDGLSDAGRLLTKANLSVAAGDVVSIAGAGSAELVNTGLYLKIVSGTVTVNPLFSVL